MAKPKLIQQVFEARYEKGYRYLDRAGEAMLVLEELLPSETGKAWMPEEIAPTGANLKCPDLEIRAIFNAYHLVIDQNPVIDDVDFAGISSMIFATISARFDLRHVVRIGSRRIYMHPTDSSEEAEALSVRLIPHETWIEAGTNLKHRSGEATINFENDDGSEGLRVSVSPTRRIEAPQDIDPRLRLPARLLPKGQDKALIDQLRRRSQREKSPIAGVVVDVDHFALRPPKFDVSTFVNNSSQKADAIASAIKPRN